MKKRGIHWDPRAPYTPKQNGKAERQNYTLLASVCSILTAQKLPKSLWGEILKTTAYPKNWSLGVDEVTFYERINNTKPFLGHLQIIEARTWVHMPKEKRKKLDNWSWQETLIGYEKNNQYCIYDPLTGKVHICQDVTVDENNVYDSKERKPWDLADIPWEESDNVLFDDPDNYDSDNQISSQLSLHTPPRQPRLLHPVGVDALERDSDEANRHKKNLDKDNFEEAEEIIPTPNSTPIPPPISTSIEPRRSTQQKFPSQKTLDNSHPQVNIFRSNQVSKSYEHMVRVLAILTWGKDNEGPDEPQTLREAKALPYWEQ